MRLPVADGVIEQMFREAASGRGYLSEATRDAPLTHEEVAAAVRGRHQWDTQAKQWRVYYRPFRDYWIALLLTVNDKIFALPVPKVIPSKVKAQYEIEDDYREQTRNL